MPDLAHLRARVEFDTRPLDAGAKNAGATIVNIGSTAKGTTAAVRELGAATDAVGASAGKTAEAVKGETSALREVTDASGAAGTGARALAKSTDEAARAAVQAGKAYGSLAAATNAYLFPKTAGQKAQAAELEAAAAAAVKLAAAEAEATKQAQALEEASRKAAKEAAEHATKAAKNWKQFGSAAGDVGHMLTVGVTLPLVALGAASVKSAMDMESLRMGLTTVTGSAAETERQLVRLKKISELPGLGFEEAVQGSIQLQAAGFKAEQAEKSIAAFGNALASAGKGKNELNAVILDLAQIQSAGKITGDEIREISRYVPQLREKIKEAFGTSDSEELQRMGVSSEEFVVKVTKALARLPPVGNSAKNAVETAADDIKQSLAKIGDAGLPVVATFTKGITPAIVGLADGFAKLPSPSQQALLIGGGILAGVAPALKGVEYLIESLAKANALSTSIGALRGGTAVATAATVAAETTAAGATAAAGGGGLLAGAGALISSPAFMIGGGVIGGYGLAAEMDRRQGKADPGVGATLAHLNPFRKDDPSLGAAISKDAARAALAQMGKTPRQAQQEKDREEAFARDTSKADAKAAKQLNLAGDAKFDFETFTLKAKLAAGDEETKAQREAAALVPQLLSRRKELLADAEALKPKIGENAEDALAYWRTQKDAAQLQEQAAELQRKAVAEVSANAKKAATAAKAHQREQFAFRDQARDNFVLAARAKSAGLGEGEDGDPNLKAIRENELLRPVLESKQQDLATQARALLATGKGDAETINEYGQLQADYWQTQIQKGNLATAAAKAEKALQKKAGEEAVKAFNAQMQIAKDQALARASEALPGQEARGLLSELAPVLKQQQGALLADLANYKVGSEDYWKAVGEVEKSKREVAKLEQNAAKEAAEQAKKAADDAKKAHRDRLQLMSAEIRLTELQLKNNPLLTERQRRNASNNMLAQQYVAAMRPERGESRQEKIARLTDAEQIKATIFENLKAQGGGRGNLLLAGRQLDQMAARAGGGGFARARLPEGPAFSKTAGLPPQGRRPEVPLDPRLPGYDPNDPYRPVTLPDGRRTTAYLAPHLSQGAAGGAQNRLADVRRMSQVAAAQAPGMLMVQVVVSDQSPAGIARAVAEALRQQRSNTGLVGAARINR